MWAQHLIVTTLRMERALSFVPSLCIQIWNNTQMSPVYSLKGKGLFHDVQTLTKKQKRKAKTELSLPV